MPIGQDSVLAVGIDQPKIMLYSTITGKKLASLEGHSNRVKGLAMSPDQGLLFSASSDGTIKVWTLPDSLVRLFNIGMLFLLNCILYTHKHTHTHTHFYYLNTCTLLGVKKFSIYEFPVHMC